LYLLRLMSLGQHRAGPAAVLPLSAAVPVMSKLWCGCCMRVNL
jgi:hypothetical protein